MEPDNKMYQIPMADMVWASSINPNFFESAKVTWASNPDGDLFFGGDTVASCPALYSHFLSSTLANIPTGKIRMVSVGNKDYTSAKITDKVSVLDWVNRLYQLTGPVKKFT